MAINEQYIDNIAQEQLLSDEEERQLADRIKVGDARALEQLTKANLRFVVSLAHHYRGHGLDEDDLVSEGNIALMHAAAQFDGSRGVRFVVFAAPFIRQAMERAIEEQNVLEDTSRKATRRGERTAPRPLSLDQSIPVGSNRTFTLHSIIEDANAMLGAPYCIDWPVRHGKGIGTSKLGKPTINQNYPADALQPCTGVYLTRIWLDGRWWPSATGIGRRPTVDAANAPVTCETYVPGYHGDTYGQTPVLEFHHYLCAVRKFGTLQELADLIETAAQQSIAYFAAKEEA